MKYNSALFSEKSDIYRERNKVKKLRPNHKNKAMNIKSDNFIANKTEKFNIAFAILEY